MVAWGYFGDRAVFGDAPANPAFHSTADCDWFSGAYDDSLGINCRANGFSPGAAVCSTITCGFVRRASCGFGAVCSGIFWQASSWAGPGAIQRANVRGGWSAGSLALRRSGRRVQYIRRFLGWCCGHGNSHSYNGAGTECSAGALFRVIFLLLNNGKQCFGRVTRMRSEEHTSELQSRPHLVCRLLLEKKKTI